MTSPNDNITILPPPRKRPSTVAPASECLDSTWFYYQHPKTGSVSSSALTLRQICRLLCPVREGLAPILASNTKCLPVAPTTITISTTQQQTSYGEWKSVSDIPILQEASCANWYYSLTGGGDGNDGDNNNASSSSSSSQGPVTCRTLLLQQEGKTKQQVLMVYAQGITNEWKKIEDVKNLNLVLHALDVAKRSGIGNPSANSNANSIHENDGTEGGNKPTQQNDDDELEEFLSTTAADMEGKDDADFEYQSDGGTTYVKDPRTGNWIHESLAPPTARRKKKEDKQIKNQSKSKIQNPNKKKSKGPSFSKRHAKCWVYVTGLPGKVSNDESYESDVARYFSKAGLLDLDPETLKPKVKIYRDKETGKLKGDASICYARSESVELALDFLDGSPWDATHTLTVQKAQFQAKQDDKDNGSGETGRDESGQKTKRRRPVVSEAKRKVAKLALLQAQDEGFGERLSGGRKGLKIIVVKNMISLKNSKERDDSNTDNIDATTVPDDDNGNDDDDRQLEADIRRQCEEFGPVEKITVISHNQVLILKFAEPAAATEAVQAWHGKLNNQTKKRMEAKYWDGVTDYTTQTMDENQQKELQRKEEERHEQFGSWLENQELPPELRLQVEDKKSS